MGNLFSDAFYDFFLNGRTDVLLYLTIWAIFFIGFAAIYWSVGSSLLKKAKKSKADIEIIKQEISELKEKVEGILKSSEKRY
ncbi:MAG: hypothetical protein V1850_02655 [Candidatus Bathyarchaeota archaeon]